MLKSKMIASALVAASMLAGAGYAAWNKTLTINHSVTTGQDVAVEFVEGSAYAKGSDYLVIAAPIQTDNSVSFSISNMYPGAKFVTNIREKNVGPLPARFDNAVVTISGTPAVINKFQASMLYFFVYNADGSVKAVLTPQFNVPISNLETALNTVLGGLVLQPGDYITLNGESADNSTLYTLLESAGPDTMNGNITFTIHLNWKQ